MSRKKIMTPEARAQAIKALRQSVIIANSAIDSMNRAAMVSDPDKFLRCWTAEQKAKKAAK